MRFDLDNCEIGLWIGSDNLSLEFTLIRELDLYLIGIFYNMVIC